MRLSADQLGSLLVAHAYLQVQRPPVLWDLETNGLEVFVRAMGEMISAGLVHNGGDLDGLVLAVSNVHVADDASDPLPAGDLVAVWVAAAGEWTDARWAPGGRSFVSPDLPAALEAAGSVYAYSRRQAPDRGSVTALYRRFPPPGRAPTAAG